MFLCFRLFEGDKSREPSGADFKPREQSQSKSNNVIVLLSSSEKLDLIFRSWKFVMLRSAVSPQWQCKRQQQQGTKWSSNGTVSNSGLFITHLKAFSDSKDFIWQDDSPCLCSRQRLICSKFLLRWKSFMWPVLLVSKWVSDALLCFMCSHHGREKHPEGCFDSRLF